MKLTKKMIESASYQGKYPQRDIRWDEEVKGFGLRVYPSGKKAFILSYSMEGRKHLLTLGGVEVLSLDQARKAAIKEIVKTHDGINPLKEKKKTTKEMKFKDLCERYLTQYARLHKKSWREDERRIRRHLVRLWGSHPVKSITRNDIADFHTKLGRTAPYEANRTLRLIQKMFTLASEWEILSEGKPNPAHNIRLFKEEKRDRWLTAEEMPRLAEALDMEQNQIAAKALWLYLFTGARKSELLNARWEDVDWERKELKLRDTKAGRVHYIPLSKVACSLLERMPPQNENPYIFPGRIKERPLANISKTWKRVCTNANLENARVHDLRRTVGSWLAQSGNSLHLIGKILNHSNQNTTAIYARFAQDQGRKALEDYAQEIQAAI